MSAKVSERAFEDAIEAALLRYGRDEIPLVSGAVAETPPPYGDPDMRPGDAGFASLRRAGQVPAQTSRKRRCQLPPMIFSTRAALQPRRSIASVRFG